MPSTLKENAFNKTIRSCKTTVDKRNARHETVPRLAPLHANTE